MLSYGHDDSFLMKFHEIRFIVFRRLGLFVCLRQRDRLRNRRFRRRGLFRGSWLLRRRGLFCGSWRFRGRGLFRWCWRFRRRWRLCRCRGGGGSRFGMEGAGFSRQMTGIKILGIGIGTVGTGGHAGIPADGRESYRGRHIKAGDLLICGDAVHNLLPKSPMIGSGISGKIFTVVVAEIGRAHV